MEELAPARRELLLPPMRRRTPNRLLARRRGRKSPHSLSSSKSMSRPIMSSCPSIRSCRVGGSVAPRPDCEPPLARLLAPPRPPPPGPGASSVLSWRDMQRRTWALIRASGNCLLQMGHGKLMVCGGLGGGCGSAREIRNRFFCRVSFSCPAALEPLHFFPMLELTFEEDASDPSSDASLPLGLTNSSVALAFLPPNAEFGDAHGHGHTPGERTSSATATAAAVAGPAATAAPLPTSDGSSPPQRNLTIGVLQGEYEDSNGEDADCNSWGRGRGRLEAGGVTINVDGNNGEGSGFGVKTGSVGGVRRTTDGKRIITGSSGGSGGVSKHANATSTPTRGRRGSAIVLDRAASSLREDMMLKNKSDESTVCGKIRAWFKLVGIIPHGHHHRLVRGMGAFVGAFTLIVPLLMFQVFMLTTFVLHCTPLAVVIMGDPDGKVTKYCIHLELTNRCAHATEISVLSLRVLRKLTRPPVATRFFVPGAFSSNRPQG